MSLLEVTFAIAFGYPLGKLAEYIMWMILRPLTFRVRIWEEKAERARDDAIRGRELSRG